MKKEDLEKLKCLNDAVESSIENRKQWLDIKMNEYAKIKVGEEIYDLRQGMLLGIVSKHYRFWEGRDNGVRDTTLDISYEYNVHNMNRCYDNTSNKSVLAGTKQQLIDKLNIQAKFLDN